MIPWFTSPAIDLTEWGLGRIDAFVVLVGLAVVSGIWVYDRLAKRLEGLDSRAALRLPEACVAGGFIGAHLVHVLFYHPELMAEDSLILFKFWAGMSSFGGFVGGAIASIVLLKIYRLPIMPYGDLLLVGLSVGWVFGRAGCAISHDHPGARTDFFLGVQYPDGVRHDLGMYEFFFTLGLVVGLYFLTKRPWRSGSVVATIGVTYAPVRFLLDFLCASDVAFADARYGGLTPAQYGSIALFSAGLGIWVWGRRQNWPWQAPLFGVMARPAPQAKSEPPPPGEDFGG